MSTEFCRQCGRSMPAEAAFCPGCGTPTGKNETVPRAPIGESVYGGGAGYSAPPPRRPPPHPGMYIRDERSLLDYLIMPWRRALDFNGRSGRKEYWAFAIPVLIVYALLVIALVTIGMTGDARGTDNSATMGILAGAMLVWALITLVPGIALAVRRLHDLDQSGWVYLAIVAAQLLFAALGLIALIVLGCMQGNYGPNRFGPDPNGGAGDAFR